MSGCVAGTPPKIPPDTAVVLLEMQPRNLDPLFAADAVSQKIGNLIHGALVQKGRNLDVVPDLAERWEIQGYRRFHFRLKPNQLFHDGMLLTAEDAARSIREFKERSLHAVAFRHITGIRAEGPLDLVLETDVPQPFLLSDLPIAKVFKRQSGRFVGSGIFKPVAESPNEITLRRFRPAPAHALSRLVLRYVRDETTRYQLLARGDGNVTLNGLSPSQTRHLRDHKPAGMAILDEPGIMYSYLCFNLRDPRLRNLKVRQAIAHSIDIEAIGKDRIGILARPARGILTPLHPGYEADIRTYGFDQEKAQRLLDEAGYPRGKDGWRMDLTFTATPEKYANDMARVLAGYLKDVGIRVRLRVVDPGTFFSEINAGNFQLFHSRWVGVANASIYFRAFHSSQIGHGVNRGAYSNPLVDSLLDKGMVEPDDRRRNEYFSRVQKIVAEELPYLSLWHWNNTFVGTSGMRNIELYPNADYLTLAGIEVER